MTFGGTLVGSPSGRPNGDAEGPRPLARLVLSPPPAWHRLAELGIRALALSAILAVVLIFVFVAREAWPLLTSDEIHKEVSLGKMWLAEQWPGYDQPEHVWQPVSEIPKYGLWPLISGTAKVDATGPATVRRC